jgi:hypothetical protein
VKVIQLQHANRSGSSVPADTQHLLYCHSQLPRLNALFGQNCSHRKMIQALPLLRVTRNSVALFRVIPLSDTTAVTSAVGSMSNCFPTGSGSGGGARGSGAVGTEPQQQQLVVPDGVWVRIGVQTPALPAAAPVYTNIQQYGAPETSAAPLVVLVLLFVMIMMVVPLMLQHGQSQLQEHAS